MYDQVKALKEGKTVEKRIYNHVTGVMDPPETIESPDILILEGLHPFADERVRGLTPATANVWEKRRKTTRTSEKRAAGRRPRAARAGSAPPSAPQGASGMERQSTATRGRRASRPVLRYAPGTGAPALSLSRDELQRGTGEGDGSAAGGLGAG